MRSLAPEYYPRTAMPSPTTTTELIDLMKKCRLFESADLDAYLAGVGSDAETAQRLADRMVDGVLWVAAEIAVVGLLGWFGRSLAGANPPRGLRGGIFLMLVATGVILFAARAVGIVSRLRRNLRRDRRE